MGDIGLVFLYVDYTAIASVTDKLSALPTIFNPLTPTVAMGTAIKHPVPDRVIYLFIIKLVHIVHKK